MADRPQEPPLGVLPEWRWRELRVRDLVLAIGRYAEHGRLSTPKNAALAGVWVEEVKGHMQWLVDNPSPGQQERLT